MSVAGTLEFVWFLVIGLSVMFYVMLDGFDLGVGMVHLFARKDHDRRVFLNAIGPVWDGNEVWLVIVGGALFAGFPDVYATLCSGFYVLVMALLAGLMFRATAIEFRSKHHSKLWRSAWDSIFCIASYLIAFGIGLIMGNLVQGIPIDEHKVFVGTFSNFFSPYSILTGVTAVALLMAHGSLFLLMKTDGALHDRVRRFAIPCYLFFAAAYIVLTSYTWFHIPYMSDPMYTYPALFLLPVFTLGAIINVPYQVYRKKDLNAFLSSCFAIIFLLGLFGIGTYPNLVRSSINPDAHSLTVYNSASSPMTLNILLIIVAIGIPMVLAYGFYIYRTFRGKVKIGPTSY